MTHPIPAEILSQHVAVLGKTGSGKTSTAKLLVEQVVADGARVCVLDPIKSDWWGLTSSADGKRAGLPFHILGGPRGHVPLHASAGKAIAEIVANGSLPLSILDMADFEPGGQAKFFVDFAPTLLRKMRGVVYLVVEEAHLFAPKERSGIGAENMSVHWSKTLATAGRSKGIRLVVLSQRVQALHNAVLGSCDTLIAHRLTAPADQKPIVDWLKANASPEVMREVSGSLASLKTGQGWICSGEARVFESRAFPRIHTYDNTATPTGDGETRDVKTAPVDQEKLRAIIGHAVDEAKANDPTELKKQLAEARRQVEQLQRASAKAGSKYSENIPDSPKVVEKKVVGAKEIARLERQGKEIAQLAERVVEALDRTREGQRLTIELLAAGAEVVASMREFVKDTQQLLAPAPAPVSKPVVAPPRRGPVQLQRRETAPRADAVDGDVRLPEGEKAILIAAAMYPDDGVTKDQLGILTGYKRSTRDAYVLRLSGKGFVVVDRGAVRATDDGIAALGDDYKPLPTGPELLAWWRARLPEGERLVLDVLVEAYPNAVPRDEIDRATAFKRSTRDAYLQRLSSRRLVEAIGRGEVKASSVLAS